MKFPRRITSLALVAVSQFGCSLDSSPTESRTHSPRVIQDAFDPEPTAAGPTLDELFLEVGKDVPGFAGLVIDSVGVLELKLVDTTDAPRAREAISRVFGESYVGNRATRAGAARSASAKCIRGERHCIRVGCQPAFDSWTWTNSGM